MKAILSILQSPGTPYGTLSSVVSKLVAKSHLWILAETSPEPSKNKIIILNFAKPNFIFRMYQSPYVVPRM